MFAEYAVLASVKLAGTGPACVPFVSRKPMQTKALPSLLT